MYKIYKVTEKIQQQAAHSSPVFQAVITRTFDRGVYWFKGVNANLMQRS